MKLRIWSALARAVITESLRRKDLWVVAILGLLIMMAAGALGFFGFSGLESFAKDLAVSVLSLFGTIIGVLTSSRLMPEEIKNRTLYPLLSRPISRFDLLFGKLLGAIVVTWISFLILCVLTSFALAIFGVGFDVLMLQYVFAKLLGFIVLCAVSLTLSLYMTPSAATTVSFVVAFGTSMIVRALTLSYATAGPTMKPVYSFANWLMPQYGLFDFGSRVANQNWGPAPAWVMAALLTYAIGYGGAMLLLGYSRFRARAI